MSLRLPNGTAATGRGTHVAMPGLEADNLLAFLALLGAVRSRRRRR